MKRLNLKLIGVAAAGYVLWAALVAGAVLLMLSGRSALMAALAGYAERGLQQRLVAGALDKAYIVVAGVAAVGIIVIIERYMTSAGTWITLAMRFLLCAAIESAALVITTGTVQIASRTFLLSPASALAFFLPLSGAALFFTASSVIRRRSKGDRSRTSHTERMT